MFMLRAILAAAVLVPLGSPRGLAAEAPSAFETEVRLGRDLVVIRLGSSPFNARASGIDTSKPWHFEGLRPISAFPDIPTDRLSTFEVVWEGQTLDIPRSLYADLFTPYLRARRGRWEDGGVLVVADETSKSILINMQATRAASCA